MDKKSQRLQINDELETLVFYSSNVANLNKITIIFLYVV